MRTIAWLVGVTTLAALPLRAAEVDRFIPADSEQVAFVNVRQALGSKLVKKHALDWLKTYLEKDKTVSDALKALRFDPLTDLDTVLVANSGASGDKALVVLRGKFDHDRVKELFEKSDSEMFRTHKDRDVIVYEVKQKDGKSAYAVFADKSTLVVGMTKDHVVKAAIGKGGKLDKDVEAGIKAVEANQTLWIVAQVPPELKKILAGQEMLADIGDKMKLMSGSVRLSDTDAAVVLKMQTSDEKASEEFGKLFDDALTLLKFAAQSNKEYATLLDDLKTVKVRTIKTTTTINLTLSEAVFEQAAKKLPKK